MALDGLQQDVRFGLRTLARQPGLSLAAVFTLALGIGALTALAGVVRSVLLDPLPYPGSSALVQLWDTRWRIGRERGHVSPADFADWRARNRSFESMAAFAEKSVNVSGGGGEPLRVEGALVSGDFFTVLRASAALGRALEPSDEGPAAAKVAVIADSLSRRLFGDPSAALGSAVFVDGVTREIVGVLPPDFHAPSTRSLAAGYLPARRATRIDPIAALHND